MADGLQKFPDGRRVQEFKSVDAAVATTTGDAVNALGMVRGRVDVNGITTATVKIMGQIGSTGDWRELASITTDGHTSISAYFPLTNIRVDVSAWTSGTVSAVLLLSTF